MPGNNHDFFKLMAAVRDSLASAYERIRSRSNEDPGTAGDQAEEDWAEILRNWLPAHYKVVTKGRILFEDGTSSPQVDILVLHPSYPRGLSREKYVFSGGVLAAFECKLCLRRRDLDKAFKVGAEIKRKSEPVLGTPYDELNSTPIFGILAHSQSLGNGRPAWKLHDVIEDYQTRYAKHPRELVDIVCVATSATLPMGKQVLIGSSVEMGERGALREADMAGAISAMYLICEEDTENKFSTGAVLASLIMELTYRLAFYDPTIRPQIIFPESAYMEESAALYILRKLSFQPTLEIKY